MRIIAKLPFDVSPSFKLEFRKEAAKLGITMTELLQRIFKTHQTITAEEEKRKKRAVSDPVKPEFGACGPRQETIS